MLCACGFFLTVYFIYPIWAKWNEKVMSLSIAVHGHYWKYVIHKVSLKNLQTYLLIQPTITTLDSTDHPVWQINFPGVTVCPANKVVEEKLAKVVEQQP